MSDFETLYKKLNPEQKEAVDTIEGPVMVVAGPGTGKTQILTLRIANIVAQSDTEPEQILALTFTESGVVAMRKRLVSIMGQDAYRVGIYTFHSFANSVIQNNPEEFPHIIGAQAITDIDQIAVLESILQEHDFKRLKPFGDIFYYLKTIKSKISELKREGVSVDEFDAIVEKAQKDFDAIDDLYHEKGAHAGKMKGKYTDLQKQIEKNQDLSVIYRMYQDRLHAEKAYDFDDMIMELLRALRENEDLLVSLQEEHQYVLVDEHQDTNNAQNKILERLVNFHDNPNLFVVGDEKQSIFRFQGASVENFFYFRDQYPEAKLITLQQNYRSTQTILHAADSLIPASQALQSNNGSPEKQIGIAEFEDEKQEHVYIAERIMDVIESGVEPSEIAVLYRNNKDAFPIAAVLEKHGIKHVIESDNDILSIPVVQDVLRLLEAVEAFEPESFARLLYAEFIGLDPFDVTRIVRSAQQKRKKMLVDILASEKDLKDIGVSKESIPICVDLAAKIKTWKQASQTKTAVSFLEQMLRESGVLENIMAKPEPAEALDAIDAFFDIARSLERANADATATDLWQHVVLLRQHDLNIKTKKGSSKTGFVRLMTAHRSKGLEFEHVFIPGVVDGVWGNAKKREMLPLLEDVYKMTDTDVEVDSQQTDDERRLFFVALTRAKHAVMLSYATMRGDGRETLPSQFIGEIKQEHVEMVDTTDFVSSWPEKQSVLFKENIVAGLQNKEYAEQMKEFIREKLFSQGLSVSALNNYLKSPWLFFFRNLVRMPSAQTRSQIYGNAVHDTLEHFFNIGKQQGGDPGVATLLELYEKKLQSQTVSKHDYDELLQKGLSSLENWYKERSETWTFDVRNEFRINGVHLRGDTENIRLTGILDKLEFVSDAHVRVVDYKTGKPKTEGQVRGTTKDSDGEYYRQLIFYKLLLRYFADGQYVMDSAQLEFIEPDTKGGLRHYEFAISDEEVDELENLIEKVVEELLSLSFWATEPSEHDEEYHELIKRLQAHSIG